MQMHLDLVLNPTRNYDYPRIALTYCRKMKSPCIVLVSLMCLCFYRDNFDLVYTHFFVLNPAHTIHNNSLCCVFEKQTTTVGGPRTLTIQQKLYIDATNFEVTV